MHRARLYLGGDVDVELDPRLQIPRLPVERDNGVRVLAPRLRAIVGPLEALQRLVAGGDVSPGAGWGSVSSKVFIPRIQIVSPSS